MPGPGDLPRRPPSANRIVALALIAFAAAIAVQFAIIAIGVGRDNPFRLFVTPLIGALIAYAGLRGYPRWGRVRLAAMVGLGVLFVSGAA